MTLHWGAEYLSKCLPPDLVSKLDENICCDPFFKEKITSLPLYNGATGEKLFDMHGIEPRRVSRKKLREFLSQGLDVQVRSLVPISSPALTGDPVWYEVGIGHR